METILTLAKNLLNGARRDMRVRWGLGAGASVLLSAGVLGIGGTITPGFLHASSTGEAMRQERAPIVETPAAPIVFPAQEKDEGFLVDRSEQTVAQIIESLPKASRFELLAYNAGLVDTLSNAGTITVFVPASAKFDYLPRGYIASLTRAQTKYLALGHMVDRALPIEESLNGTVHTLGGTSVHFEVDASAQTISVGDAQVIKAYRAKNGMVYLIDKVLVPAS